VAALASQLSLPQADGLAFQLIQGAIQRDPWIPGFLDAYQSMIAHFQSDFRQAAVFFRCQDDMHFVRITQQSSNLSHPRLNVLAQIVADLHLSTGKVNVHELTSCGK
jgi:predicted RNA-binding protein